MLLANRYIPAKLAKHDHQRERIELCNEWWREIDAQLKAHKARVYIPDICIAETFKVLAKKYYEEKWFPDSVRFSQARNRLRRDISTKPQTLMASRRRILYHDVSTSRDIIISVDRFYERFQKSGKHVSLPDLIIVATAKYLMDFFDLPKDKLHIVTMDGNLWAGTKKIQELPSAYDPTRASNRASKVFK